MSDVDTGEVSRDSIPGNMRDAWRAIQDREFIDSRKYEEQQWRAVRENAHLLILEFADAMVKRCKELGVPMYAHTIVRTPMEQAKVFAGGYSNFNGTKPYVHQHCAVDIVHGKYGWNMSKDQWKFICHIGKEVAQVRQIAIVSGGDWKNPWDPAHWELAQWRERAQEVLR